MPLLLTRRPKRSLHSPVFGYSAVVIVQQALDSSTMIEVINARPGSLLLDQVVVSGAAAVRPDSGRPTESRQLVPKSAPQPLRAAVQASPNLFRDVRGPLSPDSLAALRRRLQPLGPATGP